MTQFDLIFDHAALLSTLESSYMSEVSLTLMTLTTLMTFQIVVTTIIMGFISDNFGRRTIIVSLSGVHIIESFITSYSQALFLCCWRIYSCSLVSLFCSHG